MVHKRSVFISHPIFICASEIKVSISSLQSFSKPASFQEEMACGGKGLGWEALVFPSSCRAEDFFKKENAWNLL